MYLPAPNESNFAPCPAGTFLGICYRVLDMGTQQTTYKGQQKTAQKVLISWEIPDEKMEDGRPFTISSSYTWSMSEKANLRAILESWRGLAFTDADFGPGGFDIKNVLGKPCTLSIVHTQRDGKTYANVSSVGKAMKGIPVPALVNPIVYLWLHPERWDASVFATLSAGLQGKIMGSPEYIEMMASLNRRDPISSGRPEHHDEDAMSDPIPF